MLLGHVQKDTISSLGYSTVVDETPRAIRFDSVGEDRQERRQHPIIWYALLSL
jgi:hypothetical protein